MKYICTICAYEFDEPIKNKEINSILVRAMKIYCPSCSSLNIELTAKSKLLIERKTKIEKIEKPN